VNNPSAINAVRSPTASALLLLLSSAGCAAAERAAEKVPGKVEPVYERILGAATASPDLVAYLNPTIAERYFDDAAEDDGFTRIISAFRAIGARRGEAAARLNWGAVLWNLGDAEAAYREMMLALDLFTTIGDAEGLAHTHEWLGYTMKESGAIDPAGEHLAVAYQLFQLLGNDRAASRVLAYGD
jgi:hypothetical protein